MPPSIQAVRPAPVFSAANVVPPNKMVSSRLMPPGTCCPCLGLCGGLPHSRAAAPSYPSPLPHVTHERARSTPFAFRRCPQVTAAWSRTSLPARCVHPAARSCWARTRTAGAAASERRTRSAASWRRCGCGVARCPATR
eukprot:358375-Chlamydomonas_euryale.AAC.8